MYVGLYACVCVWLCVWMCWGVRERSCNCYVVFEFTPKKYLSVSVRARVCVCGWMGVCGCIAGVARVRAIATWFLNSLEPTKNVHTKAMSSWNC